LKLASYDGPSVFGFETDGLRRVAAISVHTSPLATLGGKDAGGMNVYVRELSCHTSKLGLPVDVFVRRTDPDAPEVLQICDNVHLINITAGPAAQIDKNEIFQHLSEFAEQVALYSVRNGVRYDVVHAHYWLSGWVAHLLKRYWETPFIQMFHTTAHMKNAVSPTSQQETTLRAQIERRLVELADSVIAANPDERADLVWRQHTQSNKVCTIPPGVDVELFRPIERQYSRSELGLPQEERIVLFIGRIDPIKGIDTLIDSMSLLDEAASTNTTLVLVGGDLDVDGRPVGPLAEVALGAQRAGIADHCRFVGSQPQDQLPLFYSAADIVVVPSRYESFGLVAVEAMACGRPVIASNVGGLTFTVLDEQTGLLVPHGDSAALAAAMSRLLEDSSLRELMGVEGHQEAQRFSWESVAQSVLHLYQRLSEGHRANLCCDQEIYA